jgi:hypothetical protein
MKITVRRTQERVIKVTTLPVELDTTDFPNFKGKSEKAFLEYLAKNIPLILKDDSYYEHPIHLLIDGPSQVYYDSAQEKYEGAFESGTINETNRETGWFDTKKAIKLEIQLTENAE